jgi:hypothetical protein
MEAVNKFLETVLRRCAGSMIDYKLVRTSDNLDAVLSHFLNYRIGMAK